MINILFQMDLKLREWIQTQLNVSIIDLVIELQSLAAYLDFYLLSINQESHRFFNGSDKKFQDRLISHESHEAQFLTHFHDPIFSEDPPQYKNFDLLFQLISLLIC